MSVVTALPARQWNECVCVNCDMPGVLFPFPPEAGKYSSTTSSTVVVGL